jgi:NO-binding membrane sensor protein with MHYT domain
VQGLAIASMHYTAMTGTWFVPLDTPIPLMTPLFSQNLMAFTIAGAMLVVCAGNLALVGFMSAQQKRPVGVPPRSGMPARQPRA